MKACRRGGWEGGQAHTHGLGSQLERVHQYWGRGLAPTPNPRAPFSKAWAFGGHAQTPQTSQKPRDHCEPVPEARTGHTGELAPAGPGKIPERWQALSTAANSEKVSSCSDHWGLRTRTSWAAPQERDPGSAHICRGLRGMLRDEHQSATHKGTAVLPLRPRQPTWWACLCQPPAHCTPL